MVRPYYPNLHKAAIEIGTLVLSNSWLLMENNRLPMEQQELLQSIEQRLSRLHKFAGYDIVSSDLLRSKTQDEFLDRLWMVDVAIHLADRFLLEQLEEPLPNRRRVDLTGKITIDGVVIHFYVEAKSWRFDDQIRDYLDPNVLSIDQRINRMKDKLSQQLPTNTIGIWAWDKLRDGAGGGITIGQDAIALGVQEKHIIQEVCNGVPQIAVIMIKQFRSIHPIELVIHAHANNKSKWPMNMVNELLNSLNASVT